MAAQPDPAGHVPLERHPGPARRPRPAARARAPWPASSGRVRTRTPSSARPSQVARSKSWVTTPTRPSQSGPARSTISATSRSVAAGEGHHLGDEQTIARRACAEVQRGPRRNDRRSREDRVEDRPRSGARPIPPATITTSPPKADSTGQRPTERSAERRAGRPASSAVSAAVAGPAARIVSSRPSGRMREIEIGGTAWAGQRDHDELSWPARKQRRVVGRQGRGSRCRPSRDAARSTLGRDVAVPVRRSSSGAGAWPVAAGRRPRAWARRRARAARWPSSSSRTSMPTGHQAMHRPQPTHPVEPNWSHQVENLCVSHWRYRSLDAWPEVRIAGHAPEARA